MATTHREAVKTLATSLRPSEVEIQLLRGLLAQAPAAIGYLDCPEFRWVFINKCYVRAMGRANAGEMLGFTVRESMPEMETSGLFELLEGVYRTGNASRGTEFRVSLQRKGSRKTEDRYFDFDCQPVFSAARRVEGILVHAVDLTDQMEIRRAVEAGGESLRLAQEAAQIGTWEWDPVENTRTLSDEMHRMFGSDAKMTPEQILKTWASRVFPADLARVEAGMAESQQTGVLDVEYRYEHPEKGMRYIYSKGRRLKGTSRFFGVNMDITDRKRAENALREREEEFRGLADAMPQLVWMANPDGGVFWFNKRWYDYTGTTEQEVRGRGWQRILDPVFQPVAAERWELSLRTEQPFEMVFPLRSKDGTCRPFLTRSVPLRDTNGKITRWFGTNTDISSEFDVRVELEESQLRLQATLSASQRLAAIVESSDDAIIGKDLDGIVTSWNPAAERMFGYKAEEMIGQSVRKIIPVEVFEDEDRIMSAVARGERTQHFETYRCRKDGEVIEVSLTVSPVRGETGEIAGVASITRDITQRKKVERALHTSERLASVGRLAATIAHEINNPLEAVTNLIYLAQNCVRGEDGDKFLSQAQQELARVALLTKQTLGFYRENKGMSELNLGDLVSPLVSVFSARARNKAIRIETDIRQNPTICAIAGEIRQLFANLLNNSIDAVRDGGRILIRVSAAQEQKGEHRAGVRLTVADTGPGIPADVREKLFEPFFTTKKDVGTGLGLWVSKSILEKHHGSIRVRSCVSPSRSWTAFSVFLPLEADPGSVG